MSPAFTRSSYIQFATRVIAIALAMIGQVGQAQTNLSDENGQWSYQLGTDLWRLNPSVKNDSLPNYVEENSNLLLPNSHTKWSYNDLSAWGRLIGTKRLENDITANTKMRADQTVGFRVDEAQIQKDISPYLGLRAGVVDYKTSWCRAYEPNNGWIHENETICNTPQFRAVTGGAPGAQVLVQKAWNDHYLLQSQFGIYRPLLWGYASKEFGNLVPSPNYQVQTNHKTGINLNLLNLHNGFEARFSYIQSYQTAYLPESQLQGFEKLRSDLTYLGLNFPLNERTSIRLTHLHQLQKGTCRSSIAKIASSCNLNLVFDKAATAIELSYQGSVSNFYSFGLSQTTFDLQQIFFTPSLDVYREAAPSNTLSKQASFAWRKNWNQHLFTIAQYLLSEHKSSVENIDYKSHGNAVGLRLGYVY